MEIFDFTIVKILSEERLSRVVRVKMIRDFYDGEKEETVGFFPAEWEAYKSRGRYPETRALDERAIAYYENMPDGEWYKSRHAAKLSDFTDEEIAAEFNRRLSSPLFHKIGYKPKIITGKVTGTGWPIDGHVLYFSMWDYDNHDSWHLYGWDDADDEAVMETMFITEEKAGLCCYDTLEDFTKDWKAKKWEPQGSFCLELDQVEVIEVKQEEQKDDTREKLRQFGIDLTPRKDGEKGGILCLPLDENLNGDTKAKHPDWELIDCPNCGRKCWKAPEAERLKKEQGVQWLCTRCALEAGLVSPYQQNNTPHPEGNRAQRRRAKREKRK